MSPDKIPLLLDPLGAEWARLGVPDAAWRLSSQVGRCESLEEVFEQADYVSINMPYIKGVTHHAISADVLAKMKPTTHLLNFARAEIVDGDALLRLYQNGHKGRYICDFADPHMQTHPSFICIPHLGASTEEAEDNCAAMAASQVINFLETGTVVNSVNFPTAHLPSQGKEHTRLCIVNKNSPGVLGAITTLLGERGVNIAQQLNTSRGDIGYNVLDLQEFPEGDAAEALQKDLGTLEGVLSTRLIWTGSVTEGPSNFYTTSA